MKALILIPALTLFLVACGKQERAARAADAKDSMVGMSMPATEVPDRSAVAPTQAAQLGITYTTARREALTRTLRTVGQVMVPEPNMLDVTPKVDGFVEQLVVNFTGQEVRKGQPLLTLYSPMLVAAQNELLNAKRLSSGMDSSAGEAWTNAQALLAAARRRLQYWDITDAQIAELEMSGTVTKTLTLVAPFDGVVLEKMVVQGQQVMPGMKLYRLGDLSTVWVEGEVFEQDLHFIQLGSEVAIEVAAHPGERRTGRVSFINPTVNEESRTNRVRVSVRNPAQWAKPGMYTTMHIDVRFGGDRPTVPLSAVVMTGARNIVFVRDSMGMLQPRDVVLGVSGSDRVEIASGLKVGETIVASANFLLDAEARIAAGGGANMAGMDMGVPQLPASPAVKPGAGKQDSMGGMNMPMPSSAPRDSGRRSP